MQQELTIASSLFAQVPRAAARGTAMAKTFLWVPCADDGWDKEVYYFGADKNIACIQRGGGLPYSGKTANWADIKGGDTLMIAAHGLPKSTEHIGWASKGKITLWTEYDLARAIRQKLSGGQRDLFVSYQLLACWGGDGWLGKDAFGAKLASVMGKAGINGRVIAYKGKFIIGATKRLVVKGSGRFTSLFGGSPTRDALNAATPTSNEDSVTINSFNLYDAKRQDVIWRIP